MRFLFLPLLTLIEQVPAYIIILNIDGYQKLMNFLFASPKILIYELCHTIVL
jgi:hypothetical protein